jgi:hypothetical protein
MIPFYSLQRLSLSAKSSVLAHRNMMCIMLIDSMTLEFE